MSKAFDNSQIINGAPAPIDADKVDGLQASSFARTSLSNVSGETVLTKIKNVDGAGSGLDADFVKGLPADFTNSITVNGYQKLPSGLIIQWGSYVKITTSPIAITFPIAFPTAVFSVVLGFEWPHNKNASAPFTIDITKTGFTSNSKNCSEDKDYFEKWIAIGY